MISTTQRPVPDNTQHIQEKNIHISGGIRTHNPSKRAAEDPRLTIVIIIIIYNMYYIYTFILYIIIIIIIIIILS